MPKKNKLFRDKLRSYRKSKGLSYAKMAEHVGMNPTHYFKVEVPSNKSGVKTLSPQTSETLMAATGLSYEDIEPIWKGGTKDAP